MERIAAADYHDIVQVEDPQLSPDGERVAFVRKVPEDDESYETTVYVAPADGSGDARRFTAEEGADAQPRWSPSGDRLAFTSVRGDPDEAVPQLYVMPTDGGEAERVTNVGGGVGAFVWSPDGDRIAFAQQVRPAERENETDLDAANDDEYEREPPDPRVIDRKIYRADGSYFDGARSHLYTVDLPDGEVTRRTDEEGRDFTAPEFGTPDELYYAVNRQEDPDDSVVIDVEVLDLTTGETAAVTRTTGWVATLAATADGRVAYPRTPEEKLSMRQTELEVYDRERDETVEVTSALDRTVTAFDWTDDEDHLLFRTPDEGDVVLRRASPVDAADTETVVEAGEVTGFSAADGRVAFVRSEWDHRGDVFVADSGEIRRLTSVNADYLADRHVGEPEELRYEAPDGQVLQGWLLTPPDFDPDGSYPLVVEIHGGPHAMWTTSGTMWQEFQTLAARGYCVFWSNPRGSTGYGEAFAMAIDSDWGDVTMGDVIAGVDHVASREYVDEENLFVTGGSFGGFMTAWIVSHTDRFAGAVSQRGVYDLASFYGSTDAFKLVEWDFDALPWERPEFLWDRSPVAHAENVTTPTLVVHADADYRVPVNNAEMLYLFYRKCGVDTRLVRYPREGHELSRSGEPAHVVDRLERIVRWFDGYSTHNAAPPATERGDDGLSTGDDSSGDAAGDASGDAADDGANEAADDGANEAADDGANEAADDVEYAASEDVADEAD